MYIERGLRGILEQTKKSLLLLGPRQTGKSTLIGELKPDLNINLAHEPTYLEFARNPSELEHRLAGGSYRTVFIDEIQRLPSLLNTLQVVLDRQKGQLTFYLTGSSARKLKRGGANLLPGRIYTYRLGPLTASELKFQLSIQDALETGTLPGIYTEPSREERVKTLRSYTATYLKEEIQAEALTKNLEGFARFLFVAASVAGHFVDLSKLAFQAQVTRQSAVRYLEILEDTLIVYPCPPFAKTLRRRLVQHPKFYFFDNGVYNALMGNFVASDDRKGILWEQLFFNQIVGSFYHRDRDFQVSTYRTEHGAEVDFVIEAQGKVWAVELKASSTIGHIDLRGFKSFASFYRKPHRAVVAYLGSVSKVIEGVSILPWCELFREIGL